MKVGDLVTWSSFYEAWLLANGWHKNLLSEKGITRKDKWGIVVNSNPKYFFVLWENNELLTHEEKDLEIISESR